MSIHRRLLVLLLVPAIACAESAPAREPDAGGGARVGPPARVERPDSVRLANAVARAAAMPRLRSLLVQWRDTLRVEEYWRGGARDRPANIKSASKSVISALVGIALARGELRGLDEPLATLLPSEAAALDSLKRTITLEDLLSMRAGLQSTSFGGYGSWVSSRHWVRDALRRPMVAPTGHEGGPMLYSTGSTHLLSAILTRRTGSTTLAYARTHLFAPMGIRLRPWTTDPQGIYFGGNEMRLTSRELLAFGTLYLRRGRAPDGRQVVPAAWVDASFVPRTTSPWNGHRYGYGWWSRPGPGGRDVHFAWGYGGQFAFVVPSLDLVVVTTSDPDAPTRDGGHLEGIHRMVDEEIIAAVGG